MTDIPGYRLLRPIGRGGMASVFLAVQESLGREVALKLLVPQAEADSAASERFLREARIAAGLHHPNIVPIFDFGVHEGVAYIAMAYEPGGTIAPLAGEKLPPRDALRLVRDVASALEYAHARGVVHRDIKPENILRREDGAAMLSDFGIARLIEGGSVLTTEGTSVGTPHYMSPEQLRGDKVDGRSDLYSLGVVLWQLLTGELPYTGTDGWAIGTQHLGADIPRLPAALAHLQPLVDTLLAKKPEGRLQDGGELVQRIDALLAAQVTPDTAPTVSVQGTARRRREDSPPAPLNPPPASPRRILGIIALALLVPIAFFSWRHVAREQHQAAASSPAPSSSAPAAASAPPAVAAPTSIAVLPLEDMSALRDQGYFSDGMAEELQSRLAQVPGLLVAGRTSSQSFKGKNATIAQVGKVLDVGNVLEGSVRKDGERLRVTMRLSNVATGFQTWTQTYDRKLTDVFAVQDDIAGDVVETLKLKLLDAATPGGARRHTPRYEVYDQYLRGRQALTRNDLSSFELGLASYRKATELDPEYADAWSGLAMAQSFVGEAMEDRTAGAQAEMRAMAAAERAVALDPTLGDAYAARGYLRTRAWDWAGALADIDRAVALDPRDGRNQLRKGFLLSSLGRIAEARAALEEGTRADPLLTPLWFWLARVNAAQGDYAAARAALSRTLEIDPGYKVAESYLGVVALLEGDAATAYAILSKSSVTFGALAAQHQLAKTPEARAAARRLIDEKASERPFFAAGAYALVGDADAAFVQLDRVVAAHGVDALGLAYEPALRSLRGDPRYGALLARMRIPPPPRPPAPPPR